ncbi:MAG: M23 family metallopeptidase, partial [Bacteroidota bacterium]
IKDQYFNNIMRTIFEEPVIDSTNYKPVDTAVDYSNISFQKSIEDSILRKHVEDHDQYSLKVFSNISTGRSDKLSDVVFFPPIKGLITNKFDLSQKHYGIDVVAVPDEAILSTLNGTVTLSTYTVGEGYVINIQHPNNIVSVYKHLSNRLKMQGDKVKAGEGIAIIGNSGEYTSGPHLHFELWYNGSPINPEDYIVFN